MIQRLIDFSLRRRGVVLGVYLAAGAWGYWALRTANVDAIPDLSDQQVIVFTDWAGHSAQEVEDQVTYPLTTNLQGLAGVRVVRSQSAFGFSMIYVVFRDDVELYFARSRVLERLALAGKGLPPGVVPTLGPDATGVGHVFWYTVESPSMSLRDLRSLQDWFIRYQLNTVPGVAEVASVGGQVQQYQVDIDANRLRGYGLTLSEVIAAVAGSNSNVGGNVVESSGSWSIVRGVGLLRSTDDLASVAIRASGGVPVFVRDVATVKIGDAFRVASLVNGTKEAVGGVIVARSGANARQVIDGVKAKLDEIRPGLPAGVRIVPFYDRSELIDRVLGTLRKTLLSEILLVTLAHVVFLLHFRSILIVTLPLPLAVLLSFLAMQFAGVTSNLMSLAGIAIAIGVLVDAGIVVTENAFREVQRLGIDPADHRRVGEAVRDSLRLVGRPVFFSMSIILLAFIPVFALTGQEGKLFHPLAFTKTSAVLAATIMALSLVPVLCTLLLRGRLHGEERNPVMQAMHRLYRPALEAALRHPIWVLTAAVMLFAGSIVVASRMGSEFMPPLNEGDLMFMPIADPSASLAETTRIAARQNSALLAFPEVASVVAKVGRAETSTDPSPLNMTETLVHLKPPAEWRAGMTLDRLRAAMGRAAQLPGVTNIWTMPIINRIDMLTTGVRSEVGVKILGADLTVLDRLAQQLAEIIRAVPGAANVYPEPLTSGQYLNITIDRQSAARYGISVAAIQETIEYAIGETPVGIVIDGRRRFPVRVRFAERFRATPDAIGDTPVMLPAGQQIPLRSVARIESARGPAMITSENGLLLSQVLLNVQERDVGSFVSEAKRVLADRLTLPAGYYLAWSGRYESQEHARARLLAVIPAAVLVVFFVLWITYRSAAEAAHVLLAVPFALTGGFYLIAWLGFNFSVAVWVGFIALFGTAVQTAVVMVIYLDDAVARRTVRDGTLTRSALADAVIEGAVLRLRPKLMTVSTVVAGLLPIMWTTDTGAEVMKPLAAPVLGGMISSLAHVLIVTPVIFFWLRSRALPDRPTIRRRAIAGAVVALVVVAIFSAWSIGRRVGRDDVSGTVIHTAHVGDVTVQLISSQLLHVGRNNAVLEFRAASSGELVDVGDVHVSAAMNMPGMAVPGTVTIGAATRPGRYPVAAEFGMAGAWRFSISWAVPAGPGSLTFDGDVR
jgi:Cu(I)/Ag(I) efflux system membrane protein CusA/SilA